MFPFLPVPSHYWTRTNHRTTKVLQILDQMDMEIATCVTKLSGMPTVDTLWEVKSLLNLLHPRLVKVTRRAPSIDMRKREVTKQLVKLEALFTKWTYILNAKEPMPYNCGGYMVSNLLSQWYWLAIRSSLWSSSWSLQQGCPSLHFSWCCLQRNYGHQSEGWWPYHESCGYYHPPCLSE